MANQEILQSQTTVSEPALRGISVAPPSPRSLDAIRSFAEQPAVRRALPAMGMAGALSVSALAWWMVQSPAQVPLYSGLNDQDKAAIAESLQSNGIGYSLDKNTGAISVDEDAFYKAKMTLAGQGLPKAAPSGDALLASLPMGSSRAIEGETLRGAREADLARTIEAIEAVKTARVLLAVSQPSVFVRDDAPPSASVLLTLQDGRALSAGQVRAIKHLVASSIPMLAADHVSVVDQSGALLTDDGAGADNATFKLQLQMEERYRKTITNLLNPVLGAGNFSTDLSVALVSAESQSTRETFPKDDRALKREEGNKTSSGTAAQAPVGIPGALSNQPPTPASVSTQSPPPAGTPVPSPNAQSAENFTRNFEVGREISVTHEPMGRVLRLSVAVALREKAGAKKLSPQELASIESLVKGAVGFDASRGDVVAITARAFSDPPVVETSLVDKPWFALLLRQLTALAVAIGAFFLIGRPVLRMLKSRREEQLAQTLQGSADQANGRTPDDVPPGGVTLEMIEAAPSYAERAALARNFVKQDPKRAALAVQQLAREGKNG